MQNTALNTTFLEICGSLAFPWYQPLWLVWLSALLYPCVNECPKPLHWVLLAKDGHKIVLLLLFSDRSNDLQFNPFKTNTVSTRLEKPTSVISCFSDVFHKDAFETDGLFGLTDRDPFWCDAHNKICLVKKQSQETDRQALIQINSNMKKPIGRQIWRDDKETVRRGQKARGIVPAVSALHDPHKNTSCTDRGQAKLQDIIFFSVKTRISPGDGKLRLTNHFVPLNASSSVTSII